MRGERERGEIVEEKAREMERSEGRKVARRVEGGRERERAGDKREREKERERG